MSIKCMPTSLEIISDTESRDYSIIRLSKDNLNDVAKLYSAVYNTAISSDYFPKKYDTAYTGIEYVGFISYDRDNQPAAYYGVIPCFIQYGNEIISAAQSADTMTHPQHRYKGMFIKLSNMTFDLCRELGIRLIFGFPNQNSYPAMINRLGWIETEKMSRFQIPVRTIWERSFFQSTKKYREKMLNKFLSPQLGVPNSVIDDGFAGVYRNEAYLAYKAFSGSTVIKIGSGDLWVKIGKELIIGDILLKGNNDKVFFKEIKELAKKLGLNKISFQTCSGSSLYDLFASRCKALPSFPVLLRDFGSGLPLEKIKFNFAEIDIF